MFKKILKWLLIVVAAIVVIVALSAWWLISDTKEKFEVTFEVEPRMIPIPDDSASIAKGEKWTKVLCESCHGENLGGHTMFEDPNIGKIDASNLTPGIGGVGAFYTDKDWIRAIKHGVKVNKHGAFVMPSRDFNYMGDNDLGCVIAYLKTLEPIDNETDPPQLTNMTYILAGIGAFGELFDANIIDHNSGSAYVPEAGPTPEYGTYLVNVFGCRTCHGMTLNGGQDPDPNAPPGPNLTKGGRLANWSADDFIATMRTGITPEGKEMDKAMPWKGLGNMDDYELTAVYEHLMSLPALETPEEFKTD